MPLDHLNTSILHFCLDDEVKEAEQEFFNNQTRYFDREANYAAETIRISNLLRFSKSAIEGIRNGETNISCDIIILLEQLHNKGKSCTLQWIPAHVNIEGHEDSARQDKIICSMQTLPRSSTHAQPHLGMPNRRNKVTQNVNGSYEELCAGTPVQP
ncbi:hypothetical protein TNCV_3354491 [Trichonephila clavipes]|nr:hypothetical protein TNCV_3354491 [Trichonephila clavipes]